MNKKVIYTCISGGYDSLLQPEVVDETFDYICFTDDIGKEKIGVWELRSIPYADINKSRESRYVKILPHKVLAEYDYSVYMDANIQILEKGFYEAIDVKIAENHLIAQVRHVIPPVDCIYDEIVNAYRYNCVSFLQARRQTKHLRKMGFPRHFGLFENNLIFRRHNEEKVQYMMEQWWSEYLNYGPRDQFTLMYVYWKNGYMPEALLGKDVCTRNTPCLKLYKHVWEEKGLQSRTERIIRSIHRRTYPYVSLFFR